MQLMGSGGQARFVWLELVPCGLLCAWNGCNEVHPRFLRMRRRNLIIGIGGDLLRLSMSYIE